MRGVMLVGTSSDVGKSLIGTAFCRILANEGIKVAPFKSQNMSNNSYVTVDGKEIGRAQGIQAEAAKVDATVWMNPILLKPQSDSTSEVVLFGEACITLSGRGYRDQFYNRGKEAIQKSLAYLEANYDMVVMEGAGSPVEINLKEKELVNMMVAELADVPVILVADIDRGGVFASIVGTIELLTPSERQRVKGIIINKFRGDLSLFKDGVEWLESRTNIPVLGVLPFIDNHQIDSEDSLSFRSKDGKEAGRTIDIAVIVPKYLSNFTDIEPFFQEEDVTIRLVTEVDVFGQPDAIILPGTKSTIKDLQRIKENGLAEKIKAFHQDGGRIIGICGGYQMLCCTLMDPYGRDTGEKEQREVGLGIIPAITRFEEKKQTVRVKGHYHPKTGMVGKGMEGYEIHVGRTEIVGKNHTPFLRIEESSDEGFYGHEGKVIGTYMHHLFFNDEWRSMWLNRIRREKGLPEREPVLLQQQKDAQFDYVAERIKEKLDWKRVREIMENGSGK